MDNNKFLNKLVNDVNYYYNKYFNRLANEVVNRGWNETRDLYSRLINQNEKVINSAKYDLRELEEELNYGDPREKYRVLDDIDKKTKIISKAKFEIQEAIEIIYYFENGFYSHYN